MVDGLKDIYPSEHFAPISITWEARPTFYLNIYFISSSSIACLIFIIYSKRVFFAFLKDISGHGVTVKENFIKRNSYECDLGQSKTAPEVNVSGYWRKLSFSTFVFMTRIVVISKTTERFLVSHKVTYGRDLEHWSAQRATDWCE